MKRKKLIQAILAKLKPELEAVLAAARAAHEAATHAESKAEDQYDTRGLEASYLAGAQAKRAAELERQVRMYDALLEAAERPPAEAIGPGSLVELQLAGKRLLYYLTLEGGGISVELDGRPVQVVTPQAPLGDALLGRRRGETVEVEIQGAPREYEVIDVHA